MAPQVHGPRMGWRSGKVRDSTYRPISLTSFGLPIPESSTYAVEEARFFFAETDLIWG